MQSPDVRHNVSALAQRLQKTENPQEWKSIAHELVPLMIEYWDLHPHSAMEMLEVCTMYLPVPLAHAFVRKIVLGWRQNPTYAPTAGGGADHCYLSALIFSENYDLAEHPWVEGRVLQYTLDKELSYSRFERMRDGARKEEIIRAIAEAVNYTPRRSS